MTKLTLETEESTILIMVPQKSISIDAAMQDLIKPILLAAGYQPENINEYIPNV